MMHVWQRCMQVLQSNCKGKKICKGKLLKKCRSAKMYTCQYSLIGPLSTRVSYIHAYFLSWLVCCIELKNCDANKKTKASVDFFCNAEEGQNSYHLKVNKCVWLLATLTQDYTVGRIDEAGRWKVCKYGGASSNVVGIICPLYQIEVGLTLWQYWLWSFFTGEYQFRSTFFYWHFLIKSIFK